MYRWCAYGRCFDLRSNNGTERYWGIVKEVHLERWSKMSVPSLMRTMLQRVVPSTIRSHKYKQAGLQHSRQDAQRSRHAQSVIDILLPPGDKPSFVQVVDTSIGLYRVCSSTGSGELRLCCVGDGSCTCGWAAFEVCKHMEAAAQHHRLFDDSIAVTRATAMLILADGKLHRPRHLGLDAQPTGGGGVWACPNLISFATAASEHRQPALPAECVCDLDAWWCTCFSFKCRGACCHLLANSMRSTGEWYLFV